MTSVHLVSLCVVVSFVVLSVALDAVRQRFCGFASPTWAMLREASWWLLCLAGVFCFLGIFMPNIVWYVVAVVGGFGIGQTASVYYSVKRLESKNSNAP